MSSIKTNTAEIPHIPVLPAETQAWAMPWNSGERRVIDGTVGFGGHSSLILQKNPDALLLGIDRDETALAFSRQRLAGYRAMLVHGNFSQISEKAQSAGWDKVDSVLLDIGVSSAQLDTPERGFSYRFDAPLDMRMDRDSNPVTAADVLNTGNETELTRIFRDYGEIRMAKKLAKEILKEREKEPIATCGRFADICERVLAGQRNGPPAPTLPFQAIRIEVNRELDELQAALESAVKILNPGGRLTVITFHSLEDRIVKRFFQSMAADCKCPPGCPVCICGWKPELKILTKHPVTASEAELAANNRSACAKLRCAEKL